jgi:hypothetical protein
MAVLGPYFCYETKTYWFHIRCHGHGGALGLCRAGRATCRRTLGKS